jgi:quinoprotein glucose dehydrogenase
MNTTTLKFVQRFLPADCFERLGRRSALRLAVLAFGCWLSRVDAQSLAVSSVAPLAAAVNPAGTHSVEAAKSEAGLTQRRAELAELAAANTAAADKSVAAWMDRLLAGTLPGELEFEVLEASVKHKVPEVQTKIRQYRDARLAEGGLATYHEVLYGGNAATGRRIFFEKTETPCSKCHRVGREGGTNGPPLDGVATNLSREVILESILYPNARITKGYESARIKLKDRRGFSGQILRDNETELTLDCPPDGEMTFKKSEILVREVGSSSMPDGLDTALSRRELRDLVEYLAGLK